MSMRKLENMERIGIRFSMEEKNDLLKRVDELETLTDQINNGTKDMVDRLYDEILKLKDNITDLRKDLREKGINVWLKSE